jgi:hypothetical protein
MAEVLIATMDCNDIVVNVYAEQVGPDVKIRLDTILDAGERADLNGFFIDFGNNGGALTYVGTKSNNMNGSDCDGVALDGFDKGVVLGTVGGSDTDYNDGSFTISGITLAQLEGAQLGIRATSVVTLDGSGVTSLKMSAIAHIPPPPEDDFPTWPQDISNIVLYFKDDATTLDTKPQNPPPGPTGDGDGYYLVKIDNWPGAAGDDVDDSIAAILAYLQQQGLIAADTDLCGVAIKGGTQTTQFYAYGAHNTNGTAADTIPAGAPDIEFGGSNPPQGQVPGPDIDFTVNYSSIFV